VKRRLLLLAAVAALFSSAPASAMPDVPMAPIRVAAYYPWFPEGWTHAGYDPFTHFRPSLGYYDAGDRSIVERHIRAMQYGRITAATYSWWGQGSRTDTRLPQYLAEGARLGFRFAVYHELEGYGDPTVAEIRADLEHIASLYAASPGYLKIRGRPVVFAYGDADDGRDCDAARRWNEANTVNAYVVLRSFRGFRSCAALVQGWHPYSADKYEFDLSPYAYTISPGFHFVVDRQPKRRRHVRTWTRSVRNMAASQAVFHYVISFNEWGEGTAIESATQWRSRSGYGHYLDVLHRIR
jgi:hypothetical protein